MRTRSLWMGFLLAGLGACGGVSEQRMSSLEAEVNALRDRQASGGDAAAGLKLDVDKRIGELQQSQKALEDKVAGMGQAGGAAAPVAAPGTPATAPEQGEVGSTGDAWMLASEALGAAVEPQVKLDGDTYKVSRAWLVEELRQAVAQKKELPKLAPDKKAGGVSVKGVKAKSLAEHLGLKSNDVIVEVSGHATPSPADLVAALKASGSPVKVKLMRKGAEVEQSYTLVD